MFVGLLVLSWCYIMCCNLSTAVTLTHFNYLHSSLAWGHEVNEAN